jgi:hypothetical protein
MFLYNSSSITHDGIKCPGLKCDGFLTLDDIKTLTVVSIAPHKLSKAEYSRIKVFMQDATVLHAVPTDSIVYCSVSHKHYSSNGYTNFASNALSLFIRYVYACERLYASTAYSC